MTVNPVSSGNGAAASDASSDGNGSKPESSGVKIATSVVEAIWKGGGHRTPSEWAAQDHHRTPSEWSNQEHHRTIPEWFGGARSGEGTGDCGIQ